MPPEISDDELKDLKAAKEEREALKKERDAHKKELDGLKAKPPPKKDEEDHEKDKDLHEKAKKQREADDKKAGDSKALEAALRFSINSEKWLKENQALLPKGVADVFKAAEKEKFESEIEKNGAIKAGIIKEFFSVQANLDLLTPGLKSTLEEYLQLTQRGRQEKAQNIFDSVFEPGFEMLRREKKAQALGKGHHESSNTEDDYKNRLIKGSRKHYLGEKDA